jgi:hypothetical protein
MKNPNSVSVVYSVVRDSLRGDRASPRSEREADSSFFKLKVPFDNG